MEQELQETEIASTDTERKFKICYSDSKIGDKAVVFLHGFGSFVRTFDQLLPHLPDGYRFLQLSMYDSFAYTIEQQADILKNFILQKNLDSIILIGHSSGAAVAALCAADKEAARHIKKLILINPLTASKAIPDFIEKIAVYNENNPLVRYASEDVFIYIFLCKAFFDERKINSSMIRSDADMLKKDTAKEQLISFARNLNITSLRNLQKKLPEINIPTLILWGAEDELFDIEDAYLCKESIHGSELKIIPHCGHLPQEELPQETAEIINNFLNSSTIPEEKNIKTLFSKHKNKHESQHKRHSMQLR